MSASSLRKSALTLAIVACASAVPAQAEGPRPIYQIICHPGNASATVERQFLEDIFLKKISTWPTGEFSHPVDQAPRSAVREQFTRTVLRRPVEAVMSYWQQRIFSGMGVPPIEFDSDDEVVRYVVKNKGAVGYVSSAAELKGARVLTVK